MEEKKKRGGKRDGAGRPAGRSDGTKKVSQGWKFSQDILRTLKEMDNATLFIETAILEKLERENIPLK